MANPQKAKGDRYENELAKYLNDNVYGRPACSRAPLSGGGRINLLTGGSDLLGTPGLFIEAKRVERLAFREAVVQAERNVSLTRAPETPVVVTRRNREATGDSLIIMRLKDFERFYRSWLASEGFI